MKRDKQIKAYAKSIFNLCLENGSLSDERVSAVLVALEKNPPRNYAPVLKEFLKLVQREIANSTAAVEYAGSLSETAIADLQTKFSNLYGRPIAVTTRPNDSLIAGLRVRVGCDLYESSIASALNELQASLS